MNAETTIPYPRPAGQVLPHGGTMLLLDEVMEVGEQFVRAKATIRPGHPFVNGRGELEPIALIEMMGQGAAALKGSQSRRPGETPRLGYLAGIKELEIKDRCRSGDTVGVEVSQTLVLGSAAVMDGRVLRDDVCLASGTLKVWEESGELLQGMAPTAAPPDEETTPGVCGEPRRGGDSPMRRAVLDSALRIEPADSENRGIAEFCFADSFPGFCGHFPGYPILPGIVMVNTTLLLAERIVGQSVELGGIERAKFTGRVLPRHAVRVEVELAPDEDGWLMKAGLFHETNRVATLRGRVTAARMR